jgi:large subunit ribosomal protein L13
MNTKTYSVKESEITHGRHVIDADGKILGKLAVEVAGLLMGKSKAMYSRHMDVGDKVVVFNATKIKVTGKKLAQKQYARHSGYAGGFRTVSMENMMETKPEFVIEHAVKGMLPQNKLGDAMIKKLTVYAGEAPKGSVPAPAKEA